MHFVCWISRDNNHSGIHPFNTFLHLNYQYMKIIFLSLALGLFLADCNNGSANSKTATVPDPGQAAPLPEKTTPVAGNETSPSPAPATSAVSSLPTFRMMNGRNQIVDLAQFKGKKVFVNLWATWCPPCRAEIPSIESLGAKLDRNKVEFVMLSLDDNFDKAKNYAANNSMKLPLYYPASDLPPLFTTEGIPVTIIFNEQGEIIYNQVGSADYDTKVFLDMLK